MTQMDRDARGLDARLERLPHLARSEARVVELLDQGGDVLAPDPCGRAAHRQNEKFLMRWAAHSARISEPGIPQTFSVYGPKNAL